VCEYGATSQKTPFYIVTAVKISNLRKEVLLETRCFYVVRAEIIGKGQSQLLGSSAPEVSKIGPERVKLNNFHC
jgi:hypothetical protein